MRALSFIRENLPWLFAGFLLALGSSFGQTFFISLFGAQYREAFGLSHGQFGGLYTIATLASAVTLVLAGGLADRLSARRLGAFVIIGLAGACLLMSQVSSVWMLALAIYGLRFAGQGMMSHVQITSIARWFAATRGRALAVASWGHPIGEGVLPKTIALMLAAMDWRMVWIICAAFLLLAFLPLFLLSLRQGERVPKGAEAEKTLTAGLDGQHWTRPEVLRHRLFWLLLPTLMASPLIGTSALFHQAHIVEIKGWTLPQFANGFAFYAVLSVGFSMLFGVLVDRYSARFMLPFYLTPLAIGMVVLGLVDAPWAALFALGAIGASAGAGMATHGAMWAELYGARHIGSIRALSVAVMVFSTALGPGVTGLLIDLGVGFETQCVWMGIIAAGMAAMMAVVMRAEGALSASRA